MEKSKNMIPIHPIKIMKFKITHNHKILCTHQRIDNPKPERNKNTEQKTDKRSEKKSKAPSKKSGTKGRINII